jgi:hypothetical protein
MPLTIVDLTTSSPPFGIPTGSRLFADTVLRNSIETAPIDQLRLTLYAICSESTTATATARSLLVTPRGSLNKEDNPNRESSANEEEEDDDEDDESDTEEDDEDEEDEEDEEEETAKTRTRKTPRALVCRLCLEDYNVNSKGRSDECITHPGKSKHTYTRREYSVRHRRQGGRLGQRCMVRLGRRLSREDRRPRR